MNITNILVDRATCHLVCNLQLRCGNILALSRMREESQINVNEPVCRLCLKTVATKRGNTTNLKSHLKHNHPTQFFNLGTTTAAGAGEGSSR